MILDTRPTTAANNNSPKVCYQFFEAVVTEERTEWPERAKRERRWFTFAQAAAQLTQRPELSEALKRSTCKR